MAITVGVFSEEGVLLADKVTATVAVEEGDFTEVGEWDVVPVTKAVKESSPV